MDKKILFLLDGAHGVNNLYTKKDDIFMIHSETIKKIEVVYPDENSFLIFGEPIAKEYDINYHNKLYKIIGEEIDDSMFLCKLLDGFCGLILSKDKSFKDTMKSRLEYKLNLKDYLKHNELFKKYKQLLNNSDKSDKSLSDNIIELIEICNLLKSYTDDFWNILLDGIIKVLSNIQTNPGMENTLYNMRLAFRDYNIINFIKQKFPEYKNIIIIIGENHIATLEAYCKKIFNITPNKLTINEEDLKPSDIMSWL